MGNLSVGKQRIMGESREPGGWFPGIGVGSLCVAAALWITLTAMGVPASEQPRKVGDGSPRVPVVFVPGVTGVELREVGSGKILWGQGRNLIFPRDHGYSVARPLTPGVAGTGVEAGEVILRIRLAGVIRKQVYQPLVELLESRGYRLGNLRDPQPEDTLFLFGYDWRRSNVESSRELLERLEVVRRSRGEERLDVILVCQSNGAHLCRYLTRYGAASLEEAEAGKARLPESLEIRKLVLMGAPNGGALRILRELNRGRRYVPWMGRKLAPEAFFAYESLYEDLPAYTDDLFVDRQGKSISVDLYDVDAWRKYQWSVFAPAVESRLARNPNPELFGDANARVAFLARTLRDARRFQTLLHRASGGSTADRYYLIRNDFNETPGRALLLEEGGDWQTHFLGDEVVDRFPSARSRLVAAGDGHATLESQLWLSDRERRHLSPRVMNVSGRHFEMIHNPEAQRYLLESLADPQIGASSHDQE